MVQQQNWSGAAIRSNGTYDSGSNIVVGNSSINCYGSNGRSKVDGSNNGNYHKINNNINKKDSISEPE